MSGWQTVEQVRALVADEVNEFVIVKATQGTTFVSAGWPAQVDAAGAKYLGAYHYAEPPQNPAAEAQHFLDTIGDRSGIIAYDVESYTGVVDDIQLAQTTLLWLRFVKTATGKLPLVYTNWLWLPPLRRGCTVAEWEELVAYPLWLAELAPAGQHSPVDPKPGSSKGWSVLVHQYAELPDSTGLKIDRDWTSDINKLKSLGSKQ